jgi:hypothetical protein
MDNISTKKLGFAFEKENYILLAASAAVVLIGFMLMSGGAAEDPAVFFPDNDPTKTPEVFSPRRITLAPIAVMLGFALGFVAILAKPESKIMKILFNKKQ